MQGRPGLQTPMKEWIHLLNQSEKIAVRISVDLPSGVTEEASHELDAFQADFTYCTGIVKKAVTLDFNQGFIGRLRYLDLGFFTGVNRNQASHAMRVLRSSALPFLRKLRSSKFRQKRFWSFTRFGWL